MKKILFALATLAVSFSAHADFQADGINQIEQFMASVNGTYSNMDGSTNMRYGGTNTVFISNCESIRFAPLLGDGYVPSFDLQVTTNSDDPKLHNDVTKIQVSDGNGSAYSPDSGNFNAAIQNSTLDLVENSAHRLEFTSTTNTEHNHDGPSAGTTSQEEDHVVVTKDANGSLASIEINQHLVEAFQFWANPFSPPILESWFTLNCSAK